MYLFKLKTHRWVMLVTVLVLFSSLLGVFFLQGNNIISVGDDHADIEDILYHDKFSLDLTEEEKLWLKVNPVVYLGIDRAFPPFGAITDNQQYIGFTADIMQMISYRLGFTFYIEKEASWEETIELAKKGQIDMIAALVDTPQRRDYLQFTAPFIKTPTIIINDGLKNGYVGSLEKLKGKRVAIEKGSYAAGEIKRKYPQIKLVPVENTSMALSLVAIGDADAYVGNAVTASFIIHKLAYHNLSFSGETEYSSNHSVGIIKPNKHLASVVTKALNSISKKDFDAITNYWFGMHIQPFISKQVAIAIGFILIGLLIFYGIWIIFLRQTKKTLKISQEALKKQSEIDDLTGLWNRRKFNQHLEQKATDNKNFSEPFSLLFLDLDSFKEVNDSLSHEIGDLLLSESSQRINKCVASFNGFVARIGGDEFVIILSKVYKKETLNRVAECIRFNISKPFYLNTNEINITCSIGITRYPKDATTAKQLVINADQAMYQSKKKGRDCYSYFNMLMFTEGQYKANLLRDIRKACNNKQFMLYYQPIIDFSTNTVTKAEALIRWNHPTRGFVSPAEFIPLAEESGLINTIGDWIFKKAIDDTLTICEQFNQDFQMTVNTSPLQYRSNGMDVSSWTNYLKSKGLSGKNLVVEITEGILMETSKSVINNLLQLSDENIDIAIDDFGTGYSSLSYLKKFDVDFLKIDQSFIKNMTTTPNDIALVQAIIVMAHQLGIKVIAEGIETQAQKQILMDAGCDYGQGFYFSKALSQKDILIFLEEWELAKL